MPKRIILTALVVGSLLSVASCSVNRLAVRAVADALTSGESTVFTGDDDPELVGDALPFAIKLYESLLEQAPDHEGLALQTGSAFIMYANAFVAGPAAYLPNDRWEERLLLNARAKRLYLRGRDILLKAVEHRHPGFQAAVAAGDTAKALSGMKKQDVPLLYWTAAGWFGAYSLDPLDLSIGATVGRAVALMDTAYRLDPDFSDGTIDDFYISYYASMPEGLGGDKNKAREHFALAVKKSGGLSAGPYLSLAGSLCIAEQNVEEFRQLIDKALAVDPDASRKTRLVNVLNQRKARWYLNHIEDFFLIDAGVETGEEFQDEIQEGDGSI